MRNNGTGLGSLGFVTIILVVVAVSSPDDWLRARLWILYALQYLLVINVLLKQKDRWKLLLSPSFVTVSYIALNSCLGAYAFNNQLVAVEEDYLSYLEWINLGWVAALILSANFVVIVPYFWAKGNTRDANWRESSPATKCGPAEKILVAGFCVSVILVFSVLDLDLSLFGSSRSFSIIPQSLGFFSAVILLEKTRQKGRYLIYILALLYFSSFSSFDKRNAIFLIGPVIFVQCINVQGIRFSWSFLVKIIVTAVSVFVLIVMMSIYRGYGNYDPDSFMDTRHYILDYITDPMFRIYAGNNWEFNYMFFHSHQSVEYILGDTQNVAFGSTFLKILYIPLPRGFFTSKPDSIVTSYSKHHAVSDSRWGSGLYSWPCTIYCEFFWNFHIAGIWLLMPIYYLFNKAYCRIVYQFRSGVKYEYILYLFAYQQMLQLIRGSGFDIFVATMLVASGVCLLLFFPVFAWLKLSNFTNLRAQGVG